MLDLLHIENIAIIERADIAFQPGFNALTGETGAGKSIVIDAMSAVLGQRASRDLLRTGADKAFVSATFSGVEPALFGEFGLEPDEELLLLREIHADGKNTCRVNGRPFTVTQLRALGSVNVNAIEEYKEVKKQFDELTEQIADLKASKEDLLNIISTLEETMKSDFLAAVEEIGVNFGQVFTELFGGGRAELRLSDPENVLESGIDINVAPPGKVIKNMSLLSGGEQAFVAIALYFAILKVNPTPFCILDEIEAALDEVNVDKFADYVKKYSDKTQFVIITHRRGTMEAAERLYGVTMHEKGISDVISIDVSEIEQKIGVTLH